MGLDVKDLARDTVDAVLMEGQGRPPKRPTGWTLWQPKSVGRVLRATATNRTC